MVTGGVDTDRRAEFTYGYFVARAKLAVSPGHRPAFWLQSKQTFKLGHGGRKGMEIDIFEQPSRHGVEGNLHWDGYDEHHKTVGRKLKQFLDLRRYHTFAVWWTPDSYKFYVDGDLVWETSAAVSQGPQFIRLTDEALSNNPRAAKDATAADGRGEFMVDYVRVYQLRSSQPK